MPRSRGAIRDGELVAACAPRPAPRLGRGASSASASISRSGASLINPWSSTCVIAALKGHGVRVGIDDPRHRPQRPVLHAQARVDLIKIDKKFVDAIEIESY